LKKLLLALGSDILMDEAISIILARDIKRSFPDFELQILPVAGIELIESITGFDFVVIIDTLITSDAESGEMIIFNGFHNARTLHLQNPHDANFHVSIRLAEALGYRIPEKIIVLGIQIKQHLLASRVPSSAILKKYENLVKQTRGVIQQQLDFWEV
jgi:hydrogenase maturation protease